MEIAHHLKQSDVDELNSILSEEGFMKTYDLRHDVIYK